MLEYIKKNPEYFNRLCCETPPNDFYTVFIQYNSETIIKRLDLKNLSDEDRNMLTFYTSGCAGTIRQWLRSGCAQSPAKLADFLMRNTPAAFMAETKNHS